MRNAQLPWVIFVVATHRGRQRLCLQQRKTAAREWKPSWSDEPHTPDRFIDFSIERFAKGS
jgi:hypothetical protein